MYTKYQNIQNCHNCICMKIMTIGRIMDKLQDAVTSFIQNVKMM